MKFNEFKQKIKEFPDPFKRLNYVDAYAKHVRFELPIFIIEILEYKRDSNSQHSFCHIAVKRTNVHGKTIAECIISLDELYLAIKEYYDDVKKYPVRIKNARRQRKFIIQLFRKCWSTSF